MSVHVLTVGTSVLRNFARAKGLDPAELEAKGADAEELASFIAQDPYSASAELNAFLRKAEECPAEGVVLLCTDTPGGKSSCKAVKKYLEAEGYSVSAYVINDLGKPKKFYDGLINLMCAFKKILDKEAGCERCVCVNPTGGFKPESAVVYLSALMDPRTKEVYYIHEAFRDVVTLPIVPVVGLAEALQWPQRDEYVEKLRRCWREGALHPWRPL
ncbi:MAG: putative CRISPR-associated protein [Crenarchaeota archaeon]|nr:putative CRISPR-associated protein [Thermoproteota archaeon]